MNAKMNHRGGGSTATPPASRTNDLLDVVLLAILCIGAYLLAYQANYFGDELTPFHFGDMRGHTFAGAYSALNEYKPRLLFNGIWAMASAGDWPRWTLLSIACAAAFAVAGQLFLVTRRQFEGSRAVAWSVAFVFLLSRFGMVTYYDYISATIELISIALFLQAALLLLLPQVAPRVHGVWRTAVVTLLCTLAVFVHERYAVASLAMGAGWSLLAIRTIRPLAINWRQVCSGMAIGIVPLLAFALANTICHSLPLSTGTAGQQVAISLGTLKAFVLYAANAFFGQNFGQPWLVGSLNLENPTGKPIVIALGLLFAFAYAALAVMIGKRRDIKWRSAFLLLATMAGFILVASLPGPGRQEGRWMIPVAVLMPLLVMVAVRGWPRALMIGILMATNLVYFAFGSHRLIVNVAASSMVDAIAGSLKTIIPTGRTGVLIDAVEPDTSWVIANQSGGMTFSRLNLNDDVVLKTPQAAAGQFDFGLAFVGMDEWRRPRYTYLSRAGARLLLEPSSLDTVDGQRFLGKQSDWKGWAFASGIKPDDSGIILRGGLDGHLSLSRAELQGRVIIYRARALESKASMRLQVNWTDNRGQLVGVFIRVVEVTPQEENFASILSAPKGASQGQVYATLHDGSSGPVLLDSIRLATVQ